jgi:hypothetical protein
MKKATKYLSILAALCVLQNTSSYSLQNNKQRNRNDTLQTAKVDRRTSIAALTSFLSSSLVTFSTPYTALASDSGSSDEQKYAYENRNRNKNKDALVRDDVWYFSGQQPPRSIDVTNLPPGPKWNAWGTCSTDSSTGNSCTYVSLKQKIPAYSNYAFTISLGSKEYSELGSKLRSLSSSNADISDSQILEVLQYLRTSENKSTPSPAIDAQLKMVLFATAVLTSPNYTGPPFELLIARFYINELNFATKEIASAIKSKDLERAVGAWEFGKDSWNSYFTIVNKAILPKVGDKFILIR